MSKVRTDYFNISGNRGIDAETPKRYTRSINLFQFVFLIFLKHISVTIEIFTDVYKIQFEKLQHARRAKKFLDARNFFGGILHVSYAPECETVEELKQKIQQRRAEVNFRNKVNNKSIISDTKRKHLGSNELNIKRIKS